MPEMTDAQHLSLTRITKDATATGMTVVARMLPGGEVAVSEVDRHEGRSYRNKLGRDGHWVSDDPVVVNGLDG
uniref:hypothetical protein n=1 Tax=Actinokineospora sp. CA-119265 TaxID=3239890 RepID=UPI003F4911BE